MSRFRDISRQQIGEPTFQPSTQTEIMELSKNNRCTKITALKTPELKRQNFYHLIPKSVSTF